MKWIAIALVLLPFVAAAGSRTVTLSDAQEAKLPLVAEHRKQLAAEVVQEAASRCVNIYIEQADAWSATQALEIWKALDPAVRSDALSDLQKRKEAQ